MDGRGECCIARYGGAYDDSKVNRILLGFRPIAPKPVVGGGSSPPEEENSFGSKARNGRCKRRYTTNKANKSTRRSCKGGKSRTSSSSVPQDEGKVVTLPLLPEAPEPKTGREISPQEIAPPPPISVLSTGNNNNNNNWLMDRNRKAEPAGKVVVVGSCVTVQCVTDTWMRGDGLGCTDEERIMNLEWDTCPGFISDEEYRVRWTNGAFKELVGQKGEQVTMVWLVLKESLPVGYPAFTCRVRVQSSSTCLKEKGSMMMTTLPCDVWRLDGGGLAWRLDVNAALSLGLGIQNPVVLLHLAP